ncbi:hypothetical protein FUA26_04655 [Seonamhaeicola algicola]|uniref:Sugar-binding protein n=1 Tax=Seonamhaeicola algicola TaxID=1719036 RepID=A0A5C7B004_9FLAO|nr:hypothetical protein [Seonamhaeicola algicola]TXE13089.1 hypothetical protein FUA26_04655 [Seonamhaeicola algicola]
MYLKIKILLTSLLLLSLNTIAQSVTNINAKDYGFEPNTKQVEITTYNIDNDSAVALEISSYSFNNEGNIESYEHRNKQNKSWEKEKNIYKKGKLHKRTCKHTNSTLNKKHYYTYDDNGNLINEQIRLNNGNTNTVKFEYKNNLLHKVSSSTNESITTYHYSQKGHLFKKVYSKKGTDKTNVISNHFYLEDKEIFSYTAPKNHYKAHIYNENVYIGFELMDDERIKSRLDRGIQRFNKEAPKDNLPFNLQKHCNQTWQFYNKNLDKAVPFEIKIHKYKKDASGNNIKYAEALVNIKTKTITSISFYKTTFKNNNVVGSTAFDSKAFSEFNEDIKFINIP